MNTCNDDRVPTRITVVKRGITVVKRGTHLCPPFRRFNASTLSERPKVTKKRSVHVAQQRPCKRFKKVLHKEKAGFAVAQHSSKEQSRQPPTDKKELRLKKQLAQAKAVSTTVAAAAGARFNFNAFRTAALAAVAAGARAHESKTNTSAVSKVVVTSDSEVSESASVSCSVSEASVPSVSPPFLAGLSEGGSELLHGRSPSSQQHCPNCRKTQCPKELKEDCWLEVTTTYKVQSTDGSNLKFSDDVTGWSGKPKSGQLCDGMDTSQVTKITTSDAFINNVHQSVSDTLFVSTPHSVRQDCLVGIQEGLASKALTVYFWRTGNSRMYKVFGIQCNHCQHAVHGTWTKQSTALAIDSLSRLFCAFVVPSASGIDNLPQLPLQHRARLTHECLGPPEFLDE